ncbi:SDR family NAD(P)-dependent oxidoreductase [Amycolatopsis saalfeldensis]|uniref:NADP-dependent 3-hydroxy acid dehydrogenase YdfG n=1 Tax=Amycolatopsis saalfeldensis TaxID=394193 RepID=A0A1H8YMX5_9PSEU|nr:SDR family NAD(P)-dependent oxidoreductase [Amycolatopsis saalfeldensis]SEP53506.1 NADP-dependent 3-hydroxy acid dehydrogenase YdfG [Amycolatopsis saalfeldensis]
MTSEQHPIGSGFGPASTVGEVLDGADLTGKLAIVTGGYSGVGIEDVRGLSAAGATVVVPARRVDEAKKALDGVERVEIGELDLADLVSVRAFTDRFLDGGREIDILINCAGVMAAPESRVGPGWEFQFAVNHLGHFALTNRLWPALSAGDGARVIAFSSRGHKFSDIRWDDLGFAGGYDKWQAYAFSLNPGGIRTNLQRHVSHEDQVQLGWIDRDGNHLIEWKSPEAGAATAAWAATSGHLRGMGGVYLEDNEVAEIVDPGAPDAMKSGLHPYAADPASAARLWDISAELTGVNAFE